MRTDKPNNKQICKMLSQRSIVKSRIEVVKINEEECQVSMARAIAEYDQMKAKELDSRNKSKRGAPVADFND